MAYMCKYCKPTKSFKQSSGLGAHLAAHHEYNCQLCTIDFGSYYTWINHYETNHPKKCLVCLEIFAGNTKSDRDEHMIQVHGYSPCNVCMRCSNDNDLTKHYANPMGMHPYRCNECKIELMSKADFWMHCYETHKFNCVFCNAAIEMKVSNKLAWDNHLRVAHRMYPCTECFEVFQVEQEFNYHYRDKHRVSCPICQESFPNEPSKAEHIRQSHQIQCLFCSEHFTCKDLLSIHIDAAHRFDCLVCERKFNFEFDRNKHVSLVHSNKVVTVYESVGDVDEVDDSDDCFMINGQRESNVCSVCSEDFADELELVLHYKRQHISVVHCLTCKVNIDTDEEAFTHQKDDHNIVSGADV